MINHIDCNDIAKEIWREIAKCVDSEYYGTSEVFIFTRYTDTS
jgi:hypothetical protein